MFQPQGRQVGVMIPAGQLTEEQRTNLPDLTIINLLPLEMFAAQYVEGGRVVAGHFVKSGDDFYLDPNGRQWLNNLRPLSAKLKESAAEGYRKLKGAVPAELPTTDQVDIVAEEVAKDGVA